MFSGSKKPYTAVTVQIDHLTSEQYEEDDISGVPDLVEVIRIQSSGPTEAARAIRKKLKYGDPHRQIRALVILDGLIQNAGSRFQRAFADEPLLERLRLLAREDMVDPEVRQKCNVLFVQWANAYKNTHGLEAIANLYKELPRSSRPAAARQKVLQDMEPLDSDPESSPVTSAGYSTLASTNQVPSPSASIPSRPVTLTPTSSGFKLGKTKKPSTGASKSFNLGREKENMTNCIARASIASTNLLNGLQLINRETERLSENQEVVNRFEICKSLRRQILFYIQHVESDEWIGSLVNANDELVKALTAYEIMDRSIDDDSDSDVAEHAHEHLDRLHIGSEARPAKPPRPAAAPTSIPLPPKPAFSKPPPQSMPDEEAEDEDNPFGDANAAATPQLEREGMTWRDV